MAYLGQIPTDTALASYNETFSGDSVTTAFVLARAVGRASDLDVYIGTTFQKPVVDYSASGTALTFVAAPTTGTNNITVVYRVGGILTVNPLDGNFGQGTAGAPTVNSTVALTSGMYWPSTTSAAISANGANRVTINSSNVASTTSTGAIAVNGGAGILANLYVGGLTRLTDTTVSTSSSTGSLVVSGGVGVSGNVNVGTDVTIGGNLTITGTFTTTAVDSMLVTDPMIYLANGNGADTVDTAVIGQYNDGTLRYAGYFRDASDSKFKFFSNLATAPTSTVSTAGTGYTAGIVTAGTFEAPIISTANITTTASNANLILTPNGTGVVRATSNLVPNANVTYDLGETALRWTNIYGVATSALYADLAEKYASDATYEPGTVMSFGGEEEVTISTEDGDVRVAGIVSTNPAYLMNDSLESNWVTIIALTGRVPCKVTGKVQKGDLMVSAGNGMARAEASPAVGSVIGKAVGTNTIGHAVIEVVVGRV